MLRHLDDTASFEKEWIQLGKEICQAVYVVPKIQEIKQSLQKNGFLTPQQRSEFIDICNRTKYELIYKKYGTQDSDGYKAFSAGWEKWFQSKGVTSTKRRTQRDSVDHILFGSTPDPEKFLLHFEEEILGSIK